MISNNVWLDRSRKNAFFGSKIREQKLRTIINNYDTKNNDFYISSMTLQCDSDEKIFIYTWCWNSIEWYKGVDYDAFYRLLRTFGMCMKLLVVRECPWQFSNKFKIKIINEQICRVLFIVTHVVVDVGPSTVGNLFNICTLLTAKPFLKKSFDWPFDP